eukprot:gene12017-16086_t
MEKFEVLIVGSTMIDMVTYTESFPRSGETIFGVSFEKNFGGKGANQAVQCARLGIKTCMYGMVGVDSMGIEYIEEFQKETINVDYIKKSSSASTGIATILVNNDGQNIIVIIPGANMELRLTEGSNEVLALENIIKRSNVILCQNEIPLETTLLTLKLAKKHNRITIFNPAPALVNLHEIISYCDILCPNETELSTLVSMPTTTETEIVDASLKLSSYGCKIVIVTLGEKGACLVQNNKASFFPAISVQTVDTVGAGDSFIGSLASNVSRGSTIEEAIKNAIFCSAMSVSKKGSQKSYLTLAEIAEINHPLPFHEELDVLSIRKILDI